MPRHVTKYPRPKRKSKDVVKTDGRQQKRHNPKKKLKYTSENINSRRVKHYEKCKRA